MIRGTNIHKHHVWPTLIGKAFEPGNDLGRQKDRIEIHIEKLTFMMLYAIPFAQILIGLVLSRLLIRRSGCRHAIETRGIPKY